MTTKDKINYNRILCVFAVVILACFAISLFVVSLLDKLPKIALKMQNTNALNYLICAVVFAMFYYFIKKDSKK